MKVTQRTLAEALSLSVRHVQRLQAEGIIKKDLDGTYDLEKNCQAYIDYKVESEINRRPHRDLEAIKAEHEEVKRQISLHQLRSMQRATVEAADVEHYQNDFVQSTREKIRALPPVIAKSVQGLSLNRQIETIEGILENALEEISNYEPAED